MVRRYGRYVPYALNPHDLTALETDLPTVELRWGLREFRAPGIRTSGLRSLGRRVGLGRRASLLCALFCAHFRARF